MVEAAHVATTTPNLVSRCKVDKTTTLADGVSDLEIELAQTSNGSGVQSLRRAVKYKPQPDAQHV
ncbi:hypothetical protein MY8738_005261 [Beauveria namnaoensis]